MITFVKIFPLPCKVIKKAACPTDTKLPYQSPTVKEIDVNFLKSVFCFFLLSFFLTEILSLQRSSKLYPVVTKHTFHLFKETIRSKLFQNRNLFFFFAFLFLLGKAYVQQRTFKGCWWWWWKSFIDTLMYELKKTIFVNFDSESWYLLF